MEIAEVEDLLEKSYLIAAIVAGIIGGVILSFSLISLTAYRAGLSLIVFKKILLTPRFSLRQIGSFRPLIRDCARLRDCTMS